MSTKQPRHQSGRRPGTTRTRDAILAAAHDAFAERGYASTTIRHIAEAAAVDPALVLHFFRNKDGLFAAALRDDSPTEGLVALSREGDVADLGHRLTGRYLELWENPETGNRLVAVVRGITASDSAASMVSAFMTEEVMLPIARGIGADRPELRANLTGAHLLGTAIARYVLRVEPLASLDRATLLVHLAPIVQHYLTGKLEDPEHAG